MAAWDNEKFLLESNPVNGPVKCADGLLGNSLCEIKSFGGKKFLIRYTGRFGGESVIDKSYIIYNNGLRFEIYSQPLCCVGTDSSKYKAVETALIQNIIDNIAKSLSFFLIFFDPEKHFWKARVRRNSLCTSSLCRARAERSGIFLKMGSRYI